jgi:hypothetical protein
MPRISHGATYSGCCLAWPCGTVSRAPLHLNVSKFSHHARKLLCLTTFLVMHSKTSLSTFPTEILLDIICSLPSLTAAFPLLSASRRFRAIWTEHAKVIYYRLSLDPCKSHALTILMDERKEAFCPSSLTVQDVLFLSRCFENVQHTIKQFEADVVSKMKSTEVKTYYLNMR